MWKGYSNMSVLGDMAFRRKLKLKKSQGREKERGEEKEKEKESSFSPRARKKVGT